MNKDKLNKAENRGKIISLYAILGFAGLSVLFLIYFKHRELLPILVITYFAFCIGLAIMGVVFNRKLRKI